MESVAPPIPRAPAWAGVAARAAGVWILAGCLAKALYGTPADLPEVVRRLPLAIGSTFALVLAIEAFVGLVTIARPGRAWPLAALLLLAFAVIATTQLVAGAKSCGCFGSTLPIPPWVMLAADLVFLALLLVARPWRLPRGGVADLAVAMVALGFAVALPRLTDREATAGGGPSGLFAGTSKPYASLDVRSWVGRKIVDTDFGKWAKLANPQDGLWILYREGCSYCAECLARTAVAERGEREITLVKVPDEDPPEVHLIPQGPFVHMIDLPSSLRWIVQVPVKVIVEGGVVKSAVESVKPDDCP